MIVFPNCKINLGLHIVNKRADGYHNIETVFYPLPFYDVLEVVQSTDSSKETELIISGIKTDGEPASNLCVKAFMLLKKDFPQLPPLKIYLHKNIPVGAGLGGGSADAAFMLVLLNEKFKLGLTRQQLLSYALELGSDCPFFILNTPSFATRRGEELEPLSIDLSSYKLILVNPGIHINTSWAFSQVTPSTPTKKLRDIVFHPVELWKQHLKNDFELPVFSAHPEIRTIKSTLYDSGAIFAGMSGSGSSVYGIFRPRDIIENSIFPGDYFVKEIPLQRIFKSY